MNNELIIYNDPKSQISEAIRTIRTNMQFSNIDKNIKTILVTSSMPGEGKSFTAANLAAAFACGGDKVLLVDCDIRKGRQHNIFNQPNKSGLSNLLIDNVEENHSNYIHPSGVFNLDILFKGSTPPNPSELLSSEKNKRLINILSKEYDVIIFDGAPLNGLPDSLVISSLVDGVIIVSAAKQTTLKALESSKRSLANVKANILGVVLNKSEVKTGKYYSKYYE